MFKGQAFHTFFLVLSFFVLSKIARVWGSEAELWGASSTTWYWISIITPVVHQVFVWLIWRLELHFKYFTNKLGDKAFKTYLIDFFILFSLI